MDFLTPHLDPGLQQPLYVQLYEYVKNEIVRGNLRTGEKLPSKRRLAAHLDISQNTIQAAYDQLTVEGYLRVAPKSGWYVGAFEELLKLDMAGTPVSPAEVPRLRYAYDFRPGGVDLENFPFTVWKRLNNEILSKRDPELLLPGNPQGYRPLRTAIAAYLHQSRGVACSADQIIVSSGTEYLMQLLIQLLGRKSVFALENPGYEKVNLIFESNEVSFVPVPVDGDGMSEARLSDSGANVTYIAPAHQFPTGVVMPIRRRTQLLAWAHELSGRFIVEDDYDSEFRYSGRPIPAMQGTAPEKVIYLGSFSKSLTSGFRISYLVLPGRLFERYAEKLSFYVCPVPIAHQKCLHLFIERGHFERHLNRMRTVYRRKRELLVGELEKSLEGLSVGGANAGLHILLRVANGMTEKELVESAARLGVGVYGTSRYYLSDRDTQEIPEIVLGYAALSESRIVEAVRLLRQAWS